MTTNVGMHPGASANSQISSANSQISSANSQISSANSQTPPNADAPGCIPTLPQRKNIRAEFHDYSGGDYFVTICTRDKLHYFGKIIDGEMRFTKIGEFADTALMDLASHYKYVEVPLYVVMPNHIHAIICIREHADAPGCIPTIRTALGVVVGGFKQSVTRFARRNNIEFNWQSRYHDHIIRGSHDGNRISEYINNNVARWADDCFYK